MPVRTMETVTAQLDLLKHFTNSKLEGLEPWQVALYTSVATLAAAYTYAQLTDKVPLSKRLKDKFFRLVRRLPMVQKRIKDEMVKVREGLVKEFTEPAKHLEDIVELPEQGWNAEQILDKTKMYLELGEFDWTQGTQSGTVYNGNPDLTKLMTEVYGMAAWTNPLHPDTFPGIRKMEAEIVRVACDLFHGDPATSCGTVTSGGTESIMLACKAYRDWARDVRGIRDPVMVVPVTAHAAFDKSAEMLDIGIVHVPVDPKTQKVDIRAMARAITSRTCMLVGSAPQFAHGSIDDIGAIAALGRRHGIPVHVDACLGGFLVAFMDTAGYPLAPFDFRVDGVTSISADTHKYGYAPKGSSVILYSDLEYRHYQWFTVVDWPGGIYATSNLGGSRAGGIIAACWAALMHYGKEGYVDCTRKIVETTRWLATELPKVDGVKVVGDPQVSVVALGSDDPRLNIYALSDLLKHRGWNLNALQFPACIHMCCTMLFAQPGVKERLVADVADCAKMIMDDPERYMTAGAAMYGSAQALPDRGIVGRLTWVYLDALYSTGNNTKDKKKE